MKKRVMRLNCQYFLEIEGATEEEIVARAQELSADLRQWRLANVGLPFCLEDSGQSI